MDRYASTIVALGDAVDFAVSRALHHMNLVEVVAELRRIADDLEKET